MLPSFEIPQSSSNSTFPSSVLSPDVLSPEYQCNLLQGWIEKRSVKLAELVAKLNELNSCSNAAIHSSLTQKTISLASDNNSLESQIELLTKKINTKQTQIQNFKNLQLCLRSQMTQIAKLERENTSLRLEVMIDKSLVGIETNFKEECEKTRKMIDSQIQLLQTLTGYTLSDLPK